MYFICVLLAPLVQFSPPLTTRSYEKQPSSHKYCHGAKGTNLTKKKLIPILVLILSIISILRLLSLTVRTSSSSPGLPAVSPAPQHSSPPLSTRSHAPGSSEQHSHRRPPNIATLILSSMNAAGSTIFLEDDHDKISKVTINSNSTRIYKVGYTMPAKEAYNLLKHARQNPACALNLGLLPKSKCKLALKKLPAEVYEKNWVSWR